MRKQDEQVPTADDGTVERMVRPGAEARWYCLSREGLATRCADEEDAKEVAAESCGLYPKNGPYRAVQLVDRQKPLTRDQISLVATYAPEGVTNDEVAEIVAKVEMLHGIRT